MINTKIKDPHDDEKADELREKLADYYGTAMASGMPMAVIELSQIATMTDEEVELEIEKNHIR